MPQVKIEAGHSNVTGQLLGYGTRIVVGGKPLTDVQGIDLHFGVDEMVRCHVEMLVTDQFEFEGNVDLHLHVHLPEGCRMIETTTHDTEGREHTVVRMMRKDLPIHDHEFLGKGPCSCGGTDVGSDVPGGGAQ